MKTRRQEDRNKDRKGYLKTGGPEYNTRALMTFRAIEISLLREINLKDVTTQIIPSKLLDYFFVNKLFTNLGWKRLAVLNSQDVNE